jgi:hypothetical protein
MTGSSQTKRERNPAFHPLKMNKREEGPLEESGTI